MVTTTDTDALIERIARALMTHECDQHEDQDECMTCDSSMVTCSHPPFMYCDEHDTAVDVGEPCPVALEHAAAVLPIVAAEVQAAKADAEHRATRAEAQSDIRGRAVVMYRDRARQAEARIKAVRDVFDRHTHYGLVEADDIRRALDGEG